MNYCGGGLQFAELPVGFRGGWEDDFLIAGIYNPHGARRWAKNYVWWLGTPLKISSFLKVKGGNLIHMYEKPSVHNGGKNRAWYAFDRSRYKWVREAPLNYETAPGVLPAGQRRGVNDDHDYVAKERGTTFAEI